MVVVGVIVELASLVKELRKICQPPRPSNTRAAAVCTAKHCSILVVVASAAVVGIAAYVFRPHVTDQRRDAFNC